MTGDRIAAMERSLWDVLGERAELGEKPLLWVDDSSLTYADALTRSAALARGLAGLGVGHGDVVATLSHNRTEQLCVWFACAALGSVWVPLNVSLVRDDLGYALADCRAAVLVVEPELADRYTAVRDQLAEPPRHVLLFGGPEHEQLTDRLADVEAAGAGADPSAYAPDPGNPLAIIYTGGSTGMPKGVLVDHRYYIGSALRYAEVSSAGPDDVHFSGGHQLFHSGGQQLAVTGPLWAGMTSVMTHWFSASRFWDVARARRATIIDPIGPMIAALVRQPASELDRGHDVRLAVGTATGQIPRGIRDEFERRFGVPLLEVYSQTETGGVLMCTERLEDRRPGSSGRTWGWATLAIVDEQDGPLPAGTQGEIVARPEVPGSFMIGYWNRPEVTAATWRNLWHHTGDIGFLDDDGYLHFVGRQAHWIRRRGENLSAFEVEQTLAQHPAVVDCAVVGVPGDQLGDEDVKAYVQLEDTVPTTPAELVAWCAERIAYFKVPRYVEFVSEFPRSASKNEIERHKLRALGRGDAWDREQTEVAR